MELVKIVHIGRYQMVETLKQRLARSWIALVVEGYDQLKLFSPKGKLLFEWNGLEPFLLLGYEGLVLDFVANEERDNWVVMCEQLDFFKPDENGYKVSFDYDGFPIVLPIVIPVAKETVYEWRRRFLKLQELWEQPIPVNRCCMEMGVIDILFHAISATSIIRTDKLAPEEKLKDLIDQDRSVRYNLAELSEQCGYSSDYLRLLFNKRYHISPAAYRNKQRMTYAMDLLTSTPLSVKDVARKTGFQYDAHFCTAFKKEFDMTPVQAIKKFRMGAII